MTKDKANRVYDLLVSVGGAAEDERDDFVYHHAESQYGCHEWRFRGKLGFGGKYRRATGRVDCYREDETPERLAVIDALNTKLRELDA